MSSITCFAKMLALLFLISTPALAGQMSCTEIFFALGAKGTGPDAAVSASPKVTVDLSLYPKLQAMLANPNKSPLAELGIKVATATNDPIQAAENLKKIEANLAQGEPPKELVPPDKTYKTIDYESLKPKYFKDPKSAAIAKAEGYFAKNFHMMIKTTGFNETTADGIKIRTEALPVTKKAKPLKPVPFGKFFLEGIESSYTSLPESAKQLGTKDNLIYFGRNARSLEHATELCEKYFTEGVAKGPNAGHYDVALHVRDKAQTSGFTNGSTRLPIAESFAGMHGGYGVVFVDDVGGVEILNVNQVHPTVMNEKEILYKGSRSPERVREAIIYFNGEPVKRYSNPNYVPSKPGTR